MLVEPVISTKQTELTSVVPKENRLSKTQDDSGHSQQKGEDTRLLQEVLNVAKQYMHASEIGINFSVHGGTGLVQVSVTDKQTGDIIREIPPEQVLNLMEKLDEMMGIIFDEKA